MQNVLNIKNRIEFRHYLTDYAKNKSESECWIPLKRGKPECPATFYYIDAVEEALCFGWIDSQCKCINNICFQRFTPRKKNSLWTELNKERVRRLEKLELMTDLGRSVLPNMNEEFKLDTDIENEMKKAKVYSTFKLFPELYQRVRGYNVAFYKNRDNYKYKAALSHLIEKTRNRTMYGQWNDYGRLLSY